MNKRIDFTRLGGFPATQYTVNWMQESYRSAFGAIAEMVGNNTIICGVEINGAQATNGWISYNGELLPFVGGAVMPTFIIEETKESRLFNDNESKEVYFMRRARFGGPGIPFNSLTRFGTVAGLWQKGDTKDIIITLEEFAADFDATGLGRNKRIGWAWINGQNGTPPGKGRVFVNYDPNQVEFNLLGKTGGAKTHTLTIAEMPAHKHPYQAPLIPGNHPGGSSGYDRPNSNNPGETGNAGGGQPHNNLQPYFVGLKIIKL